MDPREEAQSLLDRRQSPIWRWAPGLIAPATLTFLGLLWAVSSPAQRARVEGLAVLQKGTIIFAVALGVYILSCFLRSIALFGHEAWRCFWAAPRLARSLLRAIESYERIRKKPTQNKRLVARIRELEPLAAAGA